MLVIIAHGEAPEPILAALGGVLPVGATVTAEPTPWGALVLADAPHARSDRWLIAGRPQQDPWGLPFDELPLDEALKEFDRYGSRAVHLGSGPFVAVDLASGRLLPALNGIIATFEGAGANGLVLGTSRHAVRLIARGVREALPDETAGLWKLDSIASSPNTRRIRSLRWEWIDEEIAERVARLGPLVTAEPPEAPGVVTAADRWLARTASGDVIFVPPLRRAAAREVALNSTVTAQLWSRARLHGQWLYAPVLERPVRDMIGFVTEAWSPA